MMKVIIMAGGRGTRISSLFPDIPKPLIPIEGKPILARQIECLREQGFTDIIVTVSYRADQIIDYFGDGKRFGVTIEYFAEKEPLGSAGALLLMKNRLKEDFLLINADVLFDVDLHRMLDFHYKTGGLVTLFTHPNGHPYDSSVLETDDSGAIVHWWTKDSVRPQWYQNRTNAGIHIINPAVLEMAEISREPTGRGSNGAKNKVDLDRQILMPLCGTGKMFGYTGTEYVKDMGTADRYETVCRDYRNGCVHRKNLKNKQKAVFLDRDGTLNRNAGFLSNIDDFELLPGVVEAIRRINKSGYLAIVVTNQPVVARGEVTIGQLREIHNKMETLLGMEGAYLDAIYYCPHHPDKGFAGEIPELKIDCNCRKPKPGMLLQAAEDYNIDLRNSWMIGDGKNDIEAGKAAGCKTALIGEEDHDQNLTVRSLYEFSDMLYSEREKNDGRT